MSVKNCPTQNNPELFLSSEMLPNEKETLELHLAECADCRRNLALIFSKKANETETFETPKSLIETVKNLPPKESKSAFFSYSWLKIAFASVLVLGVAFVGFYVLQKPPVSSDDVLRNDAVNRNSFELLAPENNANISGENIEFRWSAMQNAKNYSLVVLDEKGDILKEISTEKTQIQTSISALNLTKEKHYFWHILVKFADGTVAESENRKISIAHR